MKHLVREGWRQRRRAQIFLEVFSGSGRLSAAMKRRGFLVLRWDILNGDAWDLLSRKNQQLIRGWVAEGVVAAIHIGTPCQSLTRARDRGPIKTVGQAGWPSRLRSDEFPWGLPQLVNPPDLMAVRVGNQLARFSASLLEHSRFHQVPATVENPSSSRLWILPPFRKLARATGWCQIQTHFCMFGKPWKKPTTFGGFFVNLVPAARLCKGRAICDRSRCAHQSLQGSGPDGRMWTKIAEPYPATLCDKLAACFEEALGTALTRKLQSLW